MEVYKQKINEITIGKKRTDIPKVKIESSRDTNQYIRNMFSDELGLYEKVVVLYLNRANNVTDFQVLSSGGINGTVVDIRLLFATALKTASNSIILCHNHPSGNLTPSEADKKITRKIKQVAEFHTIEFLDHLIVGEDETKYYSFADEGNLY